MTTSREHLIRALMAHVATNGLADASLRDLAEAVGTSHRMLHYHFGGRDGIVAAIVAEMEADQRQLLVALGDEATSPAEVVRAQWEVLTRPEVLSFVRLFFEMLALATDGRAGTGGFLDQVIAPWVEAGLVVAARVDADVDAVDLRLGIAVVRGLLVDVLATGDVASATEALERHLQKWEAAPRA